MRLIKTLESNLEKLPQGFSRVEYLESTGTQYIDTGVILTNNHTVEFTYQVTSNTQYSKGFYGCLQNNGGSNRPRHGMITRTSTVSYPGKIEYGYGTNNNNIVGSALNSSKHTVKQEKNELYVDGTLINTFATTAFTQTVSAYFGHFRYSASYTPALARYYYSKWWNGNTLVRDFIPVTDANGVGCWYDRVNEEVYYSESDEDFVVGPKIYQVEYIESTGTQYIDTGIYLTNNHSVEIKYQFTELPTIQERRGIFGTYDNSQRYGTLVSPTTNLFEYGYGLGNPWYQPHPADLKRHTFKFDKNILYEDGKHIYTFGTDAFTLTTTAYLGSFNFTNYSPAKAKYYSSKWWDGDTLVRDFVPVKSANNEYFWYDKVEGKIYYNISTGSFTGGNPYQKKIRFIKTSLTPASYTEVEYLESTGTQYIDTGYCPSSNTKIEAKFKMNETPNNFRWMFLSRNEAVAGNGYGLGCDGSGYISSEYNNRQTSSTKLTNNTDYIIVKDKNVCKINNITLTNTVSEFTVNYPLTIFALNDHGSVNTAAIPKANLYYFKIYENNVLVRDFIPVLDRNSRPALYDKVEGKYYYNKGTGEFNYGRKIYQAKYLESTGTQYIDTGIKGKNTLRTEITLQVLEIAKGTAVFGTFDSNSSHVYYIYQQGNPDASFRPPWQVGMGDFENTSTLVDLNKHTFILDNNKVYLDGNILSTFTQQTFTTTRTLILFNMHKADNTLYTAAPQRFYSCKMADAGVVVRDFIPAIDQSGIGFMFDKITHTIFDNAGTGEFIVGETLASKKEIEATSLPKGYKRVEYLESTAASTSSGPYINTGINYFADFELIAKQRESSSMKGCGVDQTHCVERENATTNAWRFRTGESTTYMFVTSALVTDLHKLKWKNNEIYVDDEKVGDFTKISVSNSFLISASNATGTNPINRYSLMVYGCRMWNPTTGALVRNYIPCLDTNNTPCLYDLVEQKPYYNAGNLSFTTGDVIPPQAPILRLNKDEIPLPQEYKRLKYLESTGTQYIITDIYPNQDTSVELIGRFNSNVPSCLCACRWSQAPNYDTFGIYADSVNTQIYCGRYSDNQYVQIPTSSVKYSNGYIKYFQHKNILSVEGIESGYIFNYEFDKQDFQSTRNITLFYFNSASSFATKGSIIKACKIWDNDNLVRNYIPVLRTTDNTPGMYDLVNKVFCTNSGTGQFLYE